jgi:hypothetical protein
MLLSSAVMILYLPASCALSSISRFHCFSGTRIVIEVSYGSLVLWGPLYFLNCCAHKCLFSLFCGSSLFSELLCKYVCDQRDSSLLLMNVRSLMANSTSNSFDCNQAACCKLSVCLSVCLCASVQC